MKADPLVILKYFNELSRILRPGQRTAALYPLHVYAVAESLSYPDLSQQILINMKLQSAKKPFAFIITAMMFSIMPSLLSAQKKCPDGNCPKNQHCVNGVCVKGTQTFCNCLVRPIPFECAAVCGWKGAAGGTISITEATTSKIGFQLQQAQKISVKIYDVTGRLIKAWQEKAFEEGEHVLVWNAPDVNGGLYVIRLDAGTYSETKRIALP